MSNHTVLCLWGINIIRINQFRKSVIVSYTKQMSASIEVIHSQDAEAPKWKHTESIIVQTAQQMQLCLRTNKNYGLK